MQSLIYEADLAIVQATRSAYIDAGIFEYRSNPRRQMILDTLTERALALSVAIFLCDLVASAGPTPGDPAPAGHRPR
jgi:hypothetical protein